MKKSLSILLFTSILFCGCSAESDSDTLPKDTPVKINAVKKVLDSSDTEGFKDGAQIGVYMTTASAGLKASGNHIHNIPFTATASGFSATGAIYPADVEKFDFFAYAPYSSSTGITAEKQLTFSVKPDQSTTLEQSDLLWATLKSNTAETVGNLVFGHKLSRIKVTLTAGIGVTLESPSVSILGTLPDVKLNMETGVLSAAEGTSISIIATNATVNEKYAIIIPQTVAKDATFISVTNSGRTHIYKLEEDKVFAPNTEYLFNIAVNRNDITVTFTGSVNGWETGDITTGSAI